MSKSDIREIAALLFTIVLILLWMGDAHALLILGAATMAVANWVLAAKWGMMENKMRRDELGENKLGDVSRKWDEWEDRCKEIREHHRKTENQIEPL